MLGNMEDLDRILEKEKSIEVKIIMDLVKKK